MILARLYVKPKLTKDQLNQLADELSALASDIKKGWSNGGHVKFETVEIGPAL